jgi:hypothetical protein
LFLIPIVQDPVAIPIVPEDRIGWPGLSWP